MLSAAVRLHVSANHLTLGLDCQALDNPSDPVSMYRPTTTDHARQRARQPAEITCTSDARQNAERDMHSGARETAGRACTGCARQPAEITRTSGARQTVGDTRTVVHVNMRKYGR